MRKLILPAILGLAGLGAGIGAGLMVPAAAPEGAGPEATGAGGANAGGEMTHGAADAAAPPAPDSGHGAPTAAATTASGHAGAAQDGNAHGNGHGTGHGAAEGGTEFVKLGNQFVIPVVEDGRIAAMVILSLTLEMAEGTGAAAYEREPKLRDAFLQVLFEHANAGGFRGAFTDAANLVVLRRSLLAAARQDLGEAVRDVLITDLARQDG
ncbi:flagellar basal body-associated FliL family protein [Frigidibacter oleivorans]|uniref:flagellar basal body-associated FliL family protein n=1 Tax=Frigidibacter oleivorans TaxID=2487129 RepID=UPI000F8D85C6|nr:flagellar basal body-associated FliL family protein [Frigidibacter oleivorans]